MFCKENMNKSALFFYLVTIYAFRLSGSIPQESEQLSQRNMVAGRGRRAPHLGPAPKSRTSKHDTNTWPPWPWTWTAGQVSRLQSVANTEDGYQGDFPGFKGVHGRALVSSSGRAVHVSEWLAMSPVLLCYHHAMTFTASGPGVTQLFVDAGGANVISLLHLPPSCGYTVWTSGRDFQMMVSHDACHIHQENGSYVLPMLWWDRPLKLTCPGETPAPASSIPDVLCSPYGMAVRLFQQDVPTLGVRVNGGRTQFVSAQCAYRVHSLPQDFIFFISFIAPCVTIGDGLQLQLVLNQQEVILACPVPATTSPPPPVQEPLQHYTSLSPGAPPGAPPSHQSPHPWSALWTVHGSSAKDQIATHIYPPGSKPASPQAPRPPTLQDYHKSPHYPTPSPSSPLLHPPKQPSDPNSFDHPHEQKANNAQDPQKPPIPSYPFHHILSPPHSERRHPYLHSDPSHFPLHPPVSRYPTQSPAPKQKPKPTPAPPSYYCEVGSVVVFLPTAHPHLIQVKDQGKWQPLSSVCGHKIHMLSTSTVILSSPLPGCHTNVLSPATISLSLRYLALSMTQYHTVDLQCPFQRSTPPPLTPSTPGKAKVSPPVAAKPKVLCSSKHMLVQLPPGPISGIVLKDAQGKEMRVQDTPKHCGYSAKVEEDGKIHLRLQLNTSCHMSVQGHKFVMAVTYLTASGKKSAHFYCPLSNSLPGQDCNLPREQRLPCGTGALSRPACLALGCCFGKHPPACYHAMDECTIDRHFVFSVPASLTEPPLSPGLLVVSNNSTCTPLRFTPQYALFKLPMDGCGARKMEMGKTLIYMVEIVNRIQTVSLNYGTITRDSPVRLLVECRYVPGSVLTVSYLVKTPTLGPAVQTQGVFGVQLRLAKDADYSSYYPQYHQPLQMLLGKPLYLEVRMLNAPDSSLVLLVHYCVAYPRSGDAVWVLLYNGCPNPLDPASQQVVLSHPPPPAPQGQTRRFTMSTFQFLPDDHIKDPDEEIYFMCSTEVCSPHDGPCVEGCFGH
ncbi:uncharacterized protein LOC133535440 [Nerophis ophidion]|uniref:uncharacterized protein LOC133535440 n=1 Tax=Nerophis ophidion TaxID=159077 RepID=UPI002ADFAE24|nr:uncharacterized protein LOC133535440 [Nerophis ophidion]